MKGLSSILFVFIFLGFIPISCKEDRDDPCGPSFPLEEYNIQSLDVKTINPYNRKVIDTALFYANDSIIKSIFPDKKEFVNLSEQPAFPYFSLVNAAYACSPVDYDTASKQSISGIQIISKTDVLIDGQVVISKDQEINSFFEIQSTTFNKNYHSFGNSGEYLQFWDDAEFWLKFKTASPDSIILVFDITVKLSNGKIFVFENEQLKLKP